MVREDTFVTAFKPSPVPTISQHRTEANRETAQAEAATETSQNGDEQKKQESELATGLNTVHLRLNP